MALWKRNNKIWYYGFFFDGEYVQASSHSKSKTVAREAMQARRRELEMGINGIAKQERKLLFKVAADQWLERKVAAAPNTRALYGYALKPLAAAFGSKRIFEIDAQKIAQYQSRRLGQVSARCVNLEVSVLRQVLKAHKLWRSLQDDVKMLPERSDVGRALSFEDEAKILETVRQSRSPALLPMFILAIHTGLRSDEMRNLRHRDLNLTWSNSAIESGWLTVSRSKTESGRGRTVPLSRRACAVLSLWLARFPDAKPDHFVFPAFKVGVSGHGRAIHAYGFDPEKAIGDWKKAWNIALAKAGKVGCQTDEEREQAKPLKYRWHDLRHTFISRLAEKPAVSEQTIMALAGHVSKAMLARYSHIRLAAKQAAIATLERPDFQAGYLKGVLEATKAQGELSQPDSPKYLN